MLHNTYITSICDLLCNLPYIGVYVSMNRCMYSRCVHLIYNLSYISYLCSYICGYIFVFIQYVTSYILCIQHTMLVFLKAEQPVVVIYKISCVSPLCANHSIRPLSSRGRKFWESQLPLQFVHWRTFALRTVRAVVGTTALTVRRAKVRLKVKLKPL